MSFELSSGEASVRRDRSPAGLRGAPSPALGDLPDECRQGLFTHPCYLAAHGIGDVLPFRRPPAADAAASSEFTFFADRRDHLLYLGRLDRWCENELYEFAARLIGEYGVKFVLFEDVELEPGDIPARLPSVRFTYHGNWRIDLSGGVPEISASQRRNMRTKARKLAKLAGGEIRFEFARATGENVERIVDLNRRKLEEAGRRHCLDDASLEAMKSVAEDIGYNSLLYADDRLVAGDVVCIAGDRGYTIAGGYDTAFAKASPGIQVHRFTIDRLHEIGCREANLLWGDSPIKAQLGARRQDLTTVAIARDRVTLLSPAFWRACAEYGIATAKDVAKRVVRR